jgi:hypothetical protein
MKKLLLILIVLNAIQPVFCQGTLRVTTGTTLKVSNGVHLVLNNMNVANNGMIQHSASEATFDFRGNLNNTISGTGNTTLSTINLAKTTSSVLTLQQNVAVSSQLVFAGGLVNLDDYIIDLGSQGVLTNESESSRAYTAGSGYIQVTGILNAPSSVNLGNLGAVITTTNNLGSTTIRRGHAAQPNVYGTRSSISRYYDFIPANNSSLNATLRVGFFDAELNGTSETSLALWKKNNNTSWTNLGSTIKDATSNYVEKQGINDFTRMTLAEECPAITASVVTGPLAPSAVNTSISVNVAYSGTNITSATINWGDGSAAQIVANPPTNFNVLHTYASAGVYTITSTLTNACGVTGPLDKYEYVVIYDPSGGFVTGGGWINSPVGAYRADVTLTGKAIFGFESKYQKGATIPTGNTEFKFQTGDMNFKSANYDWLVVSGSRAQYKGTGTINGTGNYGFLLTAVDGDLGTSKSADLFRIKIWDKNNGDALVYDNQYGASDNASLTTQLAAGSVIIHSTKTITSATASMATLDGARQVQEVHMGKLNVTALPNPSSYQFTLITKSSSDKSVNLRVTDILGRVMENRKVSANGTVVIGQNYLQGTYFVEMLQGTDKITLKLLKQPH